jgi:D-3-phosphoglycerate dehydrogenase / 2-oxoglutarate reductase
MKILVTCPPMLNMIKSFDSYFKQYDLDYDAPNIVQTMSERNLMEILPSYDGWIIGDDPATRRVFEAGASGKLRVAIKWGIGTDNVDFNACKDFNIKITNTPDMFGSEVSDIAITYLIGLARSTYYIDRQIRTGGWPKIAGVTLKDKNVAVIGFGDIGKNVAKRLKAMDMNVTIYDPSYNHEKFKQYSSIGYDLERWPEKLETQDFIILCCALSKTSHHIINEDTINLMKQGVRIINVGRGGLIDQDALESGLKNKHINSVALDVFENEPPDIKSYLVNHPLSILGSHNASNTKDAVERTSILSIELISKMLTK